MSKNKLRLPLELNDDIYDQKSPNVGSRIILTEKKEFIYDGKSRLEKNPI